MEGVEDLPTQEREPDGRVHARHGHSSYIMKRFMMLF